MKKMKINLFLAMAAIALSACNKDGVESLSGGQDGNLPSEMATVQFEARTAALNASVPTRNSITHTYSVDNLRILAFRKDADGTFKYIEDVKTDSIKPTGNTQFQNTFSGKAQLPVGTYKFIPVYGLDANVGLPTLDKTVAYSEDLALTHNPIHPLPAIFLQYPDVNVKEYTLGVSSTTPNETVQLALQRAVARLDVQFVRGNKTGDTYTEKKGDIVEGLAKLANMNITFKGITTNVNMIKGVINATTGNHTYTVAVADAKTEGIGESTKFGGEGYDFDAVKRADFIAGSMHIQGPYVFPYANDTEAASLSIEVTSGVDTANGQTYTRTIDIDGVKLLRNHVTLVKIYVPGDDLFHTNVGVEVTINKAWDDVIDDSWGSAE